MILKEIEMDMPYVRSADLISENEIREDYKNNWADKRRSFQLSTRCMTAMIERLLPKIVTKKCWKILIECVENKNEEGLKELLGVYCVQVKFNFSFFSKVNDGEKKKYIISKIREALSNIYLQDVIQTSEIIKVCDTIQKLNYCNEWYWKKTAKNQNLKAQIKIIHDISDVRIYMQIFDDNNSIIGEKLLISAAPDERTYSQYLGKIEWSSDNMVTLVSKFGDVFKFEELSRM